MSALYLSWGSVAVPIERARWSRCVAGSRLSLRLWPWVHPRARPGSWAAGGQARLLAPGVMWPVQEGIERAVCSGVQLFPRTWGTGEFLAVSAP